MEYLIANSNKNIYIKLDECGRAVTCVKSAAQKFSNQKAKNILTSLPKTLKKFNFSIVPILDETAKENTLEDEIKVIDNKVIKNDNYQLSDKIINWINRTESCNNLFMDAIARKNELSEQLSNVDKELSNCLHEVELTKAKNACEGYKEYKKIKSILEKRRVIKDELSVVQSISDCDVNFNQIECVVNRLKNREFIIREVDYTL